MTDQPISETTAEQMLEIDMLRRYIKIRARIQGPMTEGEKIALTDFAYNLGCGALFGSTLLRKHKAGDKRGASREFRRWVYAGGRRLKGLVRRRSEEKRCYRRR
jgi:lysozyme